MPGAIRRVVRLLSMRPEPAEVLVNMIALGLAWNFAHPTRFGPPGTTIAHMIDAVGVYCATGWALATALFPLVSIAAGRKLVRLASTVLCGFLWTAVVYFSWWRGTYVSLTVVLGLVGLAVLLWSQIVIFQSWPHER